jgi:hypothetical protein
LLNIFKPRDHANNKSFFATALIPRDTAYWSVHQRHHKCFALRNARFPCIAILVRLNSKDFSVATVSVRAKFLAVSSGITQNIERNNPWGSICRLYGAK